jgi:hypothetical protein
MPEIEESTESALEELGRDLPFGENLPFGAIVEARGMPRPTKPQ